MCCGSNAGLRSGAPGGKRRPKNNDGNAKPKGSALDRFRNAARTVMTQQRVTSVLRGAGPGATLRKVGAAATRPHTVEQAALNRQESVQRLKELLAATGGNGRLGRRAAIHEGDNAQRVHEALRALHQEQQQEGRRRKGTKKKKGKKKQSRREAWPCDEMRGVV